MGEVVFIIIERFSGDLGGDNDEAPLTSRPACRLCMGTIAGTSGLA